VLPASSVGAARPLEFCANLCLGPSRPLSRNASINQRQGQSAVSASEVVEASFLGWTYTRLFR